MNIFKIGLLLSVLLFNLSCSTLSKNQSECPLVSVEPKDELSEIDGNIAESSFINYEPKTNSEFSQLIDLINHLESHNEYSQEELEALLEKMDFSSDQLKSIESEIAEFDSSIMEKEFLQSLIIQWQNEAQQ